MIDTIIIDNKEDCKYKQLLMYVDILEVAFFIIVEAGTTQKTRWAWADAKSQAGVVYGVILVGTNNSVNSFDYYYSNK